MKMLVYQYDERGIFVGAEETELDPLESKLQGKEVFLLPPNATFIAPEENSGFVPVWNGEKWEQVEDHRGVEYWLPVDKYGMRAREMEEIGPLPEGATTTAPEQTDEELAAQVRSERDGKIAETDYLVMPDYPLSEEDRAIVTTYRQALRDVPAQDGFPREVAWPEIPALFKRTKG